MLTYDLDRRGKLARYDYLYRCIREDILAGRLTAGEKLPSKRSLASHLQTAVITVQNAYAQLEAEGYLYTREKRGYYVADVERHPAAPGRAPARSAPQPQRSWLLDLSSGGSGTEDFPFSVWAKLMRRVLSEEGEALLRATPPNGADALRMMLIIGSTAGNDMRYSDEKVLACRNFANKLWNASRFILMNIGDEDIKCELPANLALEDKWVISLYNDLVKEVTDNLEKFELGMAVAKLYDFIWDVFCDWYIEIAKIRLQKGGSEAKDAKQVLVWVMSNTLKLLHPFMPFITEEIWQTLPHDGESIMISAWPEFDPIHSFEAEEAEMERIMTAVRAIRNRRAEMNVPPSRKAKVYIATAYKPAFEHGSVFMQRLASASEVEVADSFELDGAVCIVTADAKIYIPMGELVDLAAEKARLNKELAAVEKDLAFVNGKLSNENFVAKAPAAVVEAQREQKTRYEEKIAMLKESIAKLG